MKANERAKREKKRAKAQVELQEAIKVGNEKVIKQLTVRALKITEQHNNDAKRLLNLMGIPYITAPGEAEAQCAAMAKAGIVDAIITEDMDALAFGAKVLLRNIMTTNKTCREFDYNKILEALDFSKEQVCICESVCNEYK